MSNIELNSEQAHGVLTDIARRTFKLLGLDTRYMEVAHDSECDHLIHMKFNLGDKRFDFYKENCLLSLTYDKHEREIWLILEIVSTEEEVVDKEIRLTTKEQAEYDIRSFVASINMNINN